MPEYTYYCEICDRDFSTFEDIKVYDNNRPPKCPYCKSRNFVSRDYSSSNVRVSVKKTDDQLTIGHLANRNRNRYNKDKIEHLSYEHNKYRYDHKEEDVPNDTSYYKRSSKKIRKRRKLRKRHRK